MVVRPKGSRGRPQTSSVSIAPLSPPQRRNPLLAEKTGYGRKSCNPVAPIWRDNVALRDRAAWGALLRERKVTGRDASLPAPCWLFPLSSFDEQRLGRCPKPHKGRRPLTLQVTLSLDPFWLPGLVALPLLFLFLRLFLLIQGFFPVKHLPHLPLRFLHHPISFLNRVLLRVVINLRPE